jgi:hypothetical protein
MKLFAFLSLLQACLVTFAQGTILFESHLGPPTGPLYGPGAELLFGTFTLDSSLLFSGKVYVVDFTEEGTSVALFRASGPSDPGTLILNFTPGRITTPFPPDPGEREFLINQPLTSLQVTDLLSGNWYVEISGITDPTASILGQTTAREQIVMVPEPSSIALLALGGLALLFVAVKS